MNIAAPARTDASLLEVIDLRKRFGGIVAVDGCSFSVAQGSITGLIGPNGSGKTTVFNMITGYLRADSGTVSMGGVQVRRPSPTSMYRRGLSRTFQQARVFPQLTLIENLVVATAQPFSAVGRAAVGRDERRRAEDLLESFGLASHSQSKAAELSFGQRKLLEFATVLMGDPRLVLLDEPASGVNPIMVEQIEDRIKRLNREGITFLVVEHDMNLVMRLCDRVVVLDHGSKIAEGSSAEVRSAPAVLEAYLGD